jgi:hypothetical protein
VSPITTTEIGSYAPSVISPGDPNQFAATVSLHRADGSLLADLRFFRPGSAITPHEFRADLNAAFVSYPLDALAPIVDVLRNEQPVYFTWFDYTAQVPGRLFGVVGTSSEPVGEAE